MGYEINMKERDCERKEKKIKYMVLTFERKPNQL